MDAQSHKTNELEEQLKYETVSMSKRKLRAKGVEVTAGGGKELRDKRPPLQVYIPRQCEKILPNEEIYQIGKDYIIVI